MAAAVLQPLLAAVLQTALLLASGVGLAFVLAGLERRASPLVVGRPHAAQSAFRPRGVLLAWLDACKLALKEDVVPAGAHRIPFVLAPVWALCSAFLLGALLPLAAPVCLRWSSDGARCEADMAFTVLRVPDGLLVFVAVAVLSVFSLVMAGWSSRSRWALLSSLRAVFQSLAFAVPMGTGVLSVGLLAGSFDLTKLALAQGEWPWQWGVWGVPHGLAFLVVWMSLVLGAPRTPFHFDDGRSEVLSCLAEYSGLRAGLFRFAELVRAVFASAFVVTVFFGAWHFPGLRWLSHHLPSGLVVALSFAAWMLKVSLASAVQLAARGSVARPRPDQVLDLVWRRVLPLGLLALVSATAWTLIRGGGTWP